MANTPQRKPELTLPELVATAKKFCTQRRRYAELYGVTDGKAVGTFIEHKFRDWLEHRYTTLLGNSASGIDLPAVEVDVKVTSVKQPQSSCPFASARQKTFGLGYHLLVFVYKKDDDARTKRCILDFIRCAFVDRSRTADYQTTRGILDILKRNGNQEDLVGFLSDRNLPGDEIVYNALAAEILKTPPEIGYLTVSNALQWRLQYGRIVGLTEDVPGIITIV